jgi:hypothetical protein
MRFRVAVAAATWRARLAIADFSLDSVLFTAAGIRQKDCFGATPKPTRETRALPAECAEIVSGIRIFCGQRFDVAEFQVNSFYAWPFCARA